MPPNIPTSVDEKVKPRSRLDGAADGYDQQQQRHSPSSTRNFLNRASMPSVASEPMSNSPPAQFQSVRGMGATSSRTSEISEDTEKSFTRDFFGSRRKLMKKALFSKRNLKSENNDDSSNDSDDSVRDPMKDLPEHLKRRDSQDKKSSAATMKPPSNFPPLRQNNSDRTFDNDYASMGRETYQQIQQRRQQHVSQQQQRYQQQGEETSPSGQLETMQEHVTRMHTQDQGVSPTEHSRVQFAESTWVAAPAPPMARHFDNDDDVSWVNDVIHQKKIMDEVIGDMQPYQHVEHYQQQHQHTGAPQYQQRQQQHDRQQYQRNQDSPLTREKYDWREFYRNESPQQRSSRPYQQYPSSRPNLDEPHPNPYAQEQIQQHHRQNYYDEPHYDHPAQYQQYARDTNLSTAWDDTSMIDDILRAADARGDDGQLLSKNELLAQMGIMPQQTIESGGQGGYEHPRPQNQRPEPPMRQNQQHESRRQVLRDQQHYRQEWHQGQNRSQVPDNQSWVQEMLASRNKGVHSSDIVDFLLESVSNPPTIEEEEALLRDRNSLESWMKDIPEGASPEVLQELMEARSASGSASRSTHHSDSETRRQISHDSHPTQSTHHSTVIQDQRGPVPTDNMFGESYEGSDSNGSRIVGDEVLVVQRSNQKTSSGSSVKKDGGSKESGQGTKSSEQTEDEITVEDLMDQLGPDLDIESVPEHVLTALGLSKETVYKKTSRTADSMNARTPIKSNNTMHATNKIPIPAAQQWNGGGSRQDQCDRPYYYNRESSPDDCVSFVDRSFANRANGTANICSSNHGEHSSLSSSQKEFATDDRGPIPEADMLEAFSASSNSISGSLKSSKHELEQGIRICNESVDERTHQSKETSQWSESNGDLKPSLGFMRYNGLQRGNYGDIPRDDLEAVVMTMRQEVIASIERGRAGFKK